VTQQVELVTLPVPQSCRDEYDHAMATELKAWFFLIISLLLLLMICSVAALGLFTRPTRWSERPSQ